MPSPISKCGWVEDDGGRAAAGWKGKGGDCVTRAIAIAAQLPYQQVYDRLAAGNASQRRGKYEKKSKAGKATALRGINTKRKWFKDYMAELGFVWVPTMKIGSGCQVHLSPDELPKGRLIASLSKHYSAVIDGVVYDAFDPNDRGVTTYPTDYLGEIPKGARLNAAGTEWIYAPLRCVYGYWKFEKAKETEQ